MSAASDQGKLAAKTVTETAESATGATAAAKPKPDKAALREISRAAAAARDARKWTEAAALYKEYIDHVPDSPSVWVQYGHMLKESGSRADAAKAYETALSLEPNNADTYLQFGHLYKIDRQKHKAIQMYKKALEVDPNMRDAAEELDRLGIKSQASSALTRGRKSTAKFYFDVSDILVFFGGSRAPTGIQRICLAMIEAAYAEKASTEIGLCGVDPRTGTWRAVNHEMFMLLALLSREGSEANDDVWQQACGEMVRDFRNGPPLAFPMHSVVVNLGSPWGIQNYFLAVRDAKRQSKIFYVGFVHDTIPLLYPEYCDANTAMAYTNWIASIGTHADLMLSNAENTKRDFETVLKKVGSNISVPCEVILPNGSFRSEDEGVDRASEEVQGVLSGRYVLFVGTIEPRKAHLFVLSAWRRLIAEFGPSKVPTLVVAGRLGWNCQSVVEFVKMTDSLDGKLKMLNSVSDVDLQALYKNAQFTVYNSHYEGWGLPVTESLSYGKVPVLPKNSSLTESGGRHAIFYETNSEPSFMAVIRDLITKPEILKQKEQQIADDPPIRSWRDIFNETYAKVTKPAEEAAKSPRSARYPARLGQIYQLRAGTARKNTMGLAIAEAARIGTGWGIIEPWGVWTSQKTFQMEFEVAGLETLPVPMDPAKPDLFVFVGLRGQKDVTRMRLEVNETPADMFTIPVDWNAVVRIELRASEIENGRIRLVMTQDVLTDLAAHSDGADDRIVGVGVRSFMVCSAQDMLARVEFLEEEGANYVIASTSKH